MEYQPVSRRFDFFLAIAKSLGLIFPGTGLSMSAPAIIVYD